MSSCIYTCHFFLPWNLHQSNPLFLCSSGKTDQTCNMHKSRNKWGAYKQTTFLANMNLALLKSHRQCGTITQTGCQESPLFTWLRYERIKHLMHLVKSNSRLLTSYSHTFLSSAVFRTLLGRSLLMISWHFMNFQNLRAEREQDSWCGHRPPSATRRTPTTQRKTLYLQTPSSRDPGSAPFSFFSTIFTRFSTASNYTSSLKTTGFT